jgi:hypothetical protein
MNDPDPREQYRGITYDATHQESIRRLAQIDAVGSRQTLQPEYLEERSAILQHLSEQGAVILRENGGFEFVGTFGGRNTILYKDVRDEF